MKPFTKIAAIVLFIVALLHLARVILKTDLIVGTETIPMWVSIMGFIVPFILAVGLWRESKG